MQAIIKSFCCILILASCAKQDFPGEASFIDTFTGSYVKEADVISHKRIIHFVITESTNDHLRMINSESRASPEESELSKKGKTISGTIKSWAVVSWQNGPDSHISHIDQYIDIDGRWEKLDGEYVITGKFSTIYHFVSTATSTDEEYPVEGSFIIRPEEN